MENKDMQGHSRCGGCGDCGHGMNALCGHSHWKHVIIKILVALFIFWCGVQFGELKGILRGGYSPYGMMGLYSERGQSFFTGPAMMGGWVRGTAATTTSW